jgi:outer membrane protein
MQSWQKWLTLKDGEMAEWFNAAVLKTVVLMGPGVRIPLSPLKAPTRGFFFHGNQTANCMPLTRYLFILISLVLPATDLVAQDTVRVSLHEFINRGIAQSDELRARQTGVRVSENAIREARLLGFLPRFELTTNHGIVPDVVSDSILASGAPLPKEEYYLDPNLQNDWGRLKVFTQMEVRMLQPIYTWGAIRSAVDAAKSGAIAAREQYLLEQSKFEVRLYELYFARLLSLELKRILVDARKTFDDAERRLQEMIDEGDPDLEDSEVYKLRIFKQEFLSRAEEVEQNDAFIASTWNLVLGNSGDAVILPAEDFLDLLEEKVSDPLTGFTSSAVSNRPETKALDAAVLAANAGWRAQRALQLPSVFLGLGAEYVYTPRPVQSQPLFGNRYNYVNLVYSFGFRQNLNFASMSQKTEKAMLQYRQAQYTRDAVVTGVMLDASEKYKNVMLAQRRVETSSEALQTSKEWLQQEQIDYDLGLGQVKNLVDAVKTNLELEVQYRQRVFEYNVSLGRLKQSSGRPILD